MKAFENKDNASRGNFDLAEDELDKVTGGEGEGDIYSEEILALAREVIRGDWGNGDERKQRLKEAGYDYNRIQNAVNYLLDDPTRHPID